jgi:hypothetical protein
MPPLPEPKSVRKASRAFASSDTPLREGQSGPCYICPVLLCRNINGEYSILVNSAFFSILIKT